MNVAEKDELKKVKRWEYRWVRAFGPEQGNPMSYDINTLAKEGWAVQSGFLERGFVLMRREIEVDVS